MYQPVLYEHNKIFLKASEFYKFIGITGRDDCQLEYYFLKNIQLARFPLRYRDLESVAWPKNALPSSNVYSL